MQTSDPDGTRGILPAVLIVGNLFLFAGWTWLRALSLGADSTDPPWRVIGWGPSARRAPNIDSILRNAEYMASFMEAVRKEKAVLFLGTSETLPSFNLGAQLNALYPQDPPMVVVAKMGTSPIHSTLLFAQCQREKIATPPLVLLINPVYFTQSHDGINNGWMSGLVRSEVFAQLDHRLILEELSADAQALYASHFRLRRVLQPLSMQIYLGNLLYLKFHQSGRPEFPQEFLPINEHRFDGALPAYDPEQGVHAGYRASDRFAKDRWTVKSVRDCANLKGLVSTAAILEKQPAPVLLLVLPANRTFYATNGLNMAEFDRRYQELRREIDRLERPGHVFVADLYDSAWLDRGFADRMHMDDYGFHQVAAHLGTNSSYRSFVETVRAYYADPR
jgi:hypothetical protein